MWGELMPVPACPGPPPVLAGTAAGQLPGSPPGHWLEVTAGTAAPACDQLPQLSAQLSQLVSAVLRPSQLLYHTAQAAQRVEGAGLVVLGPAPALWSGPPLV